MTYNLIQGGSRGVDEGMEGSGTVVSEFNVDARFKVKPASCMILPETVDYLKIAVVVSPHKTGPLSQTTHTNNQSNSPASLPLSC
jgi:hypothetical protein